MKRRDARAQLGYTVALSRRKVRRKRRLPMLTGSVEHPVLIKAPICRAPSCDATNLCDAHIIPKGFTRDILTENSRTLALTADGPRHAKPQLGEYDPEILCSDCDRVLGNLDNYGLEVCRRFEGVPVGAGQMSRLDDVDGDRFTTFVLSVLWRASISTRDTWKQTNLGPYEQVAAEVSFGFKRLSDFPEFQLMLFRYNHALGPARFYSVPARINVEGLNVVGFAAGGLRFYGKLDKRPLPEKFLQCIVNGKDHLVAYGVDIFTGPDAALFRKAAQANGRPMLRPVQI